MIDMTKDGGPAYPQTAYEDGVSVHYYGASLRDEFAKAALQGLLAQSLGVANGINPEQHATWSYAMADAMLEARKPKEK